MSSIDTAKREFIIDKTKVPLMVPSYGDEEINEVLDSLASGRVTMGEKVKQFENMFAEYIGVKYAIMVNSGSSANLIALSVLTNPSFSGHLDRWDEVITPATTWPTTVFPIINCGLIPVLVDVSLDTFNIDPDMIREAITERTRAIIPVHLLGNPCAMKEIWGIAEQYGLYVIEDACEAHGAETWGQKVGSFGDMATFSFFFTHHISTIEGGMVVTNNSEFAELARSMRSFGWIRDLINRDAIAKRYEEIDPRFLFINTGFNFRPTEIQGAFGIHQIKKLDGFIEKRRATAAYWTQNLKQWEDYLLLHNERAGTRHTWFGFPITVRANAPFTRKDLVDFLEERGVETRPIMAGNIMKQPAMEHLCYLPMATPNSDFIMSNSFFFGNHQGISPEAKQAVVDQFSEFFANITYYSHREANYHIESYDVSRHRKFLVFIGSLKKVPIKLLWWLLLVVLALTYCVEHKIDRKLYRMAYAMTDTENLHACGRSGT